MISDFPSLYESLSQTVNELQYVPDFGYKDIILIWNCLTIYDNDNIFDMINKVKNSVFFNILQNIRCSIYSLSCELYVLKVLSQESNGEIHICIDQNNFEELLLKFNRPSYVVNDNKNKIPPLIYMGFPKETNKV